MYVTPCIPAWKSFPSPSPSLPLSLPLSLSLSLSTKAEADMRSISSALTQSFLSSKIHASKAQTIMSSAPSPSSAPLAARRREEVVRNVPGLTAGEISEAATAAFARHSFSGEKRTADGVAIVWFRNDLRVLDNEALFQAWAASSAVVPVYCVDPRHFGSTHSFGFPKTGAWRAKFLLECLHDLKKNLKDRGLDLLVKRGRPEDILPSIAKAFEARTVFAQRETCSEELHVERLVIKRLQQVELLQQGLPITKIMNPKLHLIWGCSMYHIDDLQFEIKSLPDVYTQFRKFVESKSPVRECCKLPVSLGPPPSGSLDEVGGWGSIPSLWDLGLQEVKLVRGMHFIGGENAAFGRVFEYFWKKDSLRVYKETRNGMLGPDYSTKFSPWLASGSLSPRYVHSEVKRYEKERLANDSTYWVLFELIWRDYFRFLSIKYGNSIFQLDGPRKVVAKWNQDQSLFESWRGGRTGSYLLQALCRIVGVSCRVKLKLVTDDSNACLSGDLGFMEVLSLAVGSGEIQDLIPSTLIPPAALVEDVDVGALVALASLEVAMGAVPFSAVPPSMVVPWPPPLTFLGGSCCSCYCSI